MSKSPVNKIKALLKNERLVVDEKWLTKATYKEHVRRDSNHKHETKADVDKININTLLDKLNEHDKSIGR
jgi:hypothetical protein